MLINKKLGFGPRAIARPSPPTLSQRIDALSKQSSLDPKLDAVHAAIVAADGNANLAKIAAALDQLRPIAPGLKLLEKLLPEFLKASHERDKQLERIADALCRVDDALKGPANRRRAIAKAGGGRSPGLKTAAATARKRP